MNRSFLNIITTEGKEYRLAEFGFHADLPSFKDGGIVYRRGDDNWERIDLNSGRIAPCTDFSTTTAREHISPNGNCSLCLRFDSELIDGRGYVHMILKNSGDKSETVLVRFMGSENSIGALPFSPDGKSIVFFGYPEKDDI